MTTISATIPTIWMQYPERYAIDVDYTDHLPDGRTVASAAVSAVYEGTVIDATFFVVHTPTATVNGTLVTFTLKYASSYDYLVSVTATLDNGDKLIDLVRLRELNTAIPLTSFVKRPGEQYSMTLNFTDRLPRSRSLASGTIAAVNQSTLADATSTVLVSATLGIAGALAAFTVKDGTAGIVYQLKATLTLDNGDTLVEILDMVVTSS